MSLSYMPCIRKCTKFVLLIRAVLIALIIVNLVFVWCNSAKVSTESDKSSKKLATGVAKVVVDDYDSLPEPVQKEHVKRLNVKLRSMGHFVEFVPLGFLLCLFVLSLIDTKGRKLLYVFGCCVIATVIAAALFALGDEIHQIFVKGRTFQLQDIAVDTLGSLTGCVVAMIPVTVFKKKIL